MFYFKKVYINDLPKADVERLLRKAAIKCDSSLEFVSASTNIGSAKIFVGSIETSALKFTRLHTSLEWFLPKLLIKFPLDTDDCCYQLRLKGLSVVVCFVMTLFLMLMLVQTVAGRARVDDLGVVFLMCIVYFALILLEIKITSARINKALNPLN